jgi:hypothetical protein
VAAGTDAMTVMMPHRGSRSAMFAPIEDSESRLAKVIWSTSQQLYRDGEYHTLDLAGGDLSNMQGHGPLLVQHSTHAEDIIGVIETTWVEGPIGVSLVRFARHDRAEYFFGMLLDQIPLAASLGYAITRAEPADDHSPDRPHYIARRWRGDEISVVGFGRDEGARFDTSLQGLVDLQQTKRVEIETAKRVERRLQLRADRWKAWAADGAATSLAHDLGAPISLVRSRLSDLVDEHLAQLEASA